jgi:hypothetical protein
MTGHTCFYMKYRKSPTNDDAIQKEERWVCDNCHTERIVVKEIPNPTEKPMLVKHLMSLGERYELAGMTVTVQVNAVVAKFRFPEHDLPKLREIAYNWAERGYITARQLLMLERAGMADVARIPPRWAPPPSLTTGLVSAAFHRGPERPLVWVVEVVITTISVTIFLLVCPACSVCPRRQRQSRR